MINLISRVTVICCLLTLFWTNTLIAQNNPTDTTQQASEVELLTAGELEMITEEGLETRYLRSNDSLRVSFKQDDMLLYCDEAVQFPDSNFVVAFGKSTVFERR